MLNIWSTETIEPKAFTLSIGFGDDANCVARLRYLDSRPRFPRTEKLEAVAKTPEAAVALLNAKFLRLIDERGEFEHTDEITVTIAEEMASVERVIGEDADDEIPF